MTIAESDGGLAAAAHGTPASPTIDSGAGADRYACAIQRQRRLALRGWRHDIYFLTYAFIA
jgi:hypothetical protein